MAPRPENGSPEAMRTAYRAMLLIRRFEEKAGQLYGMGLIGGFCHLYIGQEAVVVGLEACARAGDKRLTSYRDHGHMLACGMDPKRIMAELTGREAGYSGGKGGSMHMFSPKHGFFGGHGILGAQVPIGAGLAFAEKYRRTSNVVFCYFGDGAAHQGQIAETYHLAALWALPIIFVIENNQHSHDSAARAKGPGLLDRAAAYGIPGRRVDGMDVLAVEEAGQEAALHVRAGKGPYALEVTTYRYRGHSMADPAKYRTRDEMRKVRDDRDPIDNLRQRLLEAGTPEDELKTLDREIKALVNASADFARESPEPGSEALLADVTAEV